jgi:Ca2+-binding RTX toxin-like protein
MVLGCVTLLLSVVWCASTAWIAWAGEPAPCRYDPKTGRLLVGPPTAFPHRIRIHRSGSDIMIDARSCGATVENTDLIRIIGRNDRDDTVALNLDGGPFAPGRTAESDSLSEIEISADLGDTGRDSLVIFGASGADTFVAGSRGIDMNADGDMDLTTGGISHIVLLTRGGPDGVTMMGGNGTGAPLLSTVVFLGGRGPDTANFGHVPEGVFYAGFGDDMATTKAGGLHFQGGGGDDVLIGGAGNDQLSAGPGKDDLRGRGGNDYLLDDGLNERDRFSGGRGVDELWYLHQTQPDLTLTLDGIANDGMGGEHENIPSDFERITLGAGDDTFVGDDRPTTVFGGKGADLITGGGGRDDLYGQIGEDVFHTLDGYVDRIWGGNGEDDATDRDPNDRVRQVEAL